MKSPERVGGPPSTAPSVNVPPSALLNVSALPTTVRSPPSTFTVSPTSTPSVRSAPGPRVTSPSSIGRRPATTVGLSEPLPGMSQ